MSNLIKLSKRWAEVIAITALIRILLLILGTIVNYNKNLNPLYYWIQWDGPHYIDLAKNWYQPSGEQSLWIVFYPLYPILIKVFNLLINDFASTTIIVSIIFSFTAAISLYELVLLDFNKRVAFLSVWFLNIFPTAYFLQASYGESIFLTLSLLTIYFFRKNHFLSSGIVSAFSTITRINGLLLLPILLFEMKNFSKSIVTFVLLPVGFLTYLTINYMIYGNPIYFLEPLQTNWYKRTQLPWIGIKNLLNSVPNFSNPDYYIYISEIVAILFITIFSLIVFLSVRKSYGIYMFLNLLLITSTSFILSTPRYALILFPIYIALGKIKNMYFTVAASIISILLLLFFSTIYVRGQWAY